MRESERRYALAVQGSAEGIWDYHVDTGYAFYSRRWQEIAGVEPGQIEPSLEGWFGRVHPEDRAMVEQKVDDHLSGRTEHLDIEHRLSHGDGTWRWVQIRGVAAREDDIGQRLAGSMSDVTALKLAYQQLEAARDRAVEANRTKSLFLANMSHELRTPLNAIIGYSEMLQEDAEDLGEDQFVSDLDRIKAAASHLLTLINDVLDISKIEAGKMELFLENFDVREVLDGIVNQFRPLIEKSGNTLEFDFGDQLGSMRADLTKFRQTMLNLLGNANKFTDHGTIRFSAHRAEDGLEFVVTDTGIGMTAEQVSKLFHAFVQGDASTTRKYGGTGLGLAISQRFCEMMGGRITVRSREGQGSTFTVRLPVTVRSPRERRQSRAPGEPAMVVLIDDDPSMQELLERSLGKRGIRVRGALNGVEGMRLVRELSPDAIVLDVMMPGMDGWTVLTELKNDLELAHIPVVMLTIVDQRELGIMLGAAEYLLKPVDPDRLTSVLERLRGNEHPAPVLVVEDDPDTQELFRRVLGSDGWDVDVAENGKVALEQLQRGKVPDAILLDLMMPEMDGFEFLAHLRRKPEWVSIPVAVVTAKELTEEDRARLAGSVERVLQKGAYTKEQLCQLVHEVVTAAVGPR
jgi:PAS domain S-box-containing protein